MSVGIILVHGYSGSSRDLQPLATALAAKFGEDSVNNLILPGHDSPQVPEFDEHSLVNAVYAAIQTYRKGRRKIILIGHSTGGNLILAAIHKYAFTPNLLVLMAVPPKVDRGYGPRWEAHRSEKTGLPLVDVAMMVKLINATGSKSPETDFPVLILQGEEDQLVLSDQAQAWKEDNFPSARVVTIPGAGHDVFQSTNSRLFTDLIQRAINDLILNETEDLMSIHSLIAVEPGFQAFFEAAPLSRSHLALSPGVQRVIAQKPALSPLSKNDPVIANIEITTYCNLQCQFCARSRLKKANTHMTFAMFRNILAVLPNTYQIVLVGLGEPLIHPHIGEFIQYAKSLKKRVGLVTNAMLLTPEISARLLDAGLDSIAFSLDGADPSLSALVRQGTNLPKVIRNIKKFVKNAQGKPISTAVFAAVSIDTVAQLKKLIDCVSGMRVEALMLTDINFITNLDHTLWQNYNTEIESLVKQGITHAFTKNLPVLSVHGLEEFGLKQRYHDFLIIPPGQLCQRSARHTWCLSPWQTVPIDVAGNITLCDCQPDCVIGNLFQDTFSNIWNGETMQKHRADMLSDKPPEACRICPRF
jgi:MoaA/NifB/PqqE/SkfB family radical SAM enzyme/alpha-beta hydrolase superfamily lysophospholipase